ncbi:hypothetical protein HDU67_005994 [Dinochytrium kinnereticum]|nr:hypothetical protein HDU67_005994 [Dinochytrium kinnereticum]
MGDAGFFKGASAEQDARFGDKHKKLLKTMKFPAIYNTKVDMKKVKLSAMKPWITKKVVEIVGMEDDLVVGYVFQMLEVEKVDPRELQINLTGFLEGKTASFVEQLWGLLVSAQEEHGIPKLFLEEKKLELIRKRAEEDRIAKELAKRRETEGDSVKSRPQKEKVVAPEGSKNGGAEDRRVDRERERDRDRDDRTYRPRDYDRDRERDRDRDRDYDRDEDRRRRRDNDDRRRRYDDDRRSDRDREKDRDRERDRERERERDRDRDRDRDRRDRDRDGDRDRDRERDRDRGRDGEGDREKERGKGDGRGGSDEKEGASASGGGRKRSSSVAGGSPAKRPNKSSSD